MEKQYDQSKRSISSDNESDDTDDTYFNTKGSLNNSNNNNNNSNSQRRRSKTSKFRGVCWSRQRKMWRARIKVYGKLEHLGYFCDEEEAARKYDQRSFMVNKEAGIFNFPDDVLKNMDDGNQTIVNANANATPPTKKLCTTAKYIEAATNEKNLLEEGPIIKVPLLLVSKHMVNNSFDHANNNNKCDNNSVNKKRSADDAIESSTTSASVLTIDTQGTSLKPTPNTRTSSSSLPQYTSFPLSVSGNYHQSQRNQQQQQQQQKQLLLPMVSSMQFIKSLALSNATSNPVSALKSIQNLQSIKPEWTRSNPTMLSSFVSSQPTEMIFSKMDANHQFLFQQQQQLATLQHNLSVQKQQQLVLNGYPIMIQSIPTLASNTNVLSNKVLSAQMVANSNNNPTRFGLL